MPLIIFSHANSFPASTYSVMLKSLRGRGFTVKALEKFGHDPHYPVSNNWPHLVRQLHDFTRREVDKAGQPAFLVGHSMGGFLSLICAAQNPVIGGHPVRGVLMLDTPVTDGWRAATIGIVKRTQLVGSLSPGRVSRARRNRWPDQATAVEHFRHKRAFARWEPQVLADYVAHGTHDEEGERALSFCRDVETKIYNTVPHNVPSLLRRHPLKCPVGFIGGTRSAEMKLFGLAMTEKLVKGRVMMIDGGHLFPMEKPVATAAAIEASLRCMGA